MHEIENLDKIVSLGKTWHGLETIVPKIEFNTSGLDWNIAKRSIKTAKGIKIPDYSAIVCQDNDHVISVQKASYEVIQNSRIWEALEKSLEGVDHTIQVTGSLRNRSRVFISISLDEKQEYVVNREKFKNELVFVTSHDGSLALEAYDTSVRVVCSNTLNWSRMPENRGSIKLRVRHTKNNDIYIGKMEEALEDLFEKRDEFYLRYKKLTEQPMTLDLANKVAVGLIAGKDKISTRAQNVSNRIVELFQSGQGNEGKTRADFLNGVTEYYTHECSENDAKRFDSNEYGVASKRKIEALGTLLNDETLNQIAKRGEELLKAEMDVTV